MKKILAITAAALLLGSATAAAQEYRYEIGPALGVDGYLGDVNDGNMYKHPGVTAGAVMRYNMDSRWAFKANLLYAGLSGNSNDIDRKIPGQEPYSFKSHVIDLGMQAEFNFLHYGIGARYKNYKRLSPYMVLGLGLTTAIVDGKVNKKALDGAEKTEKWLAAEVKKSKLTIKEIFLFTVDDNNHIYIIKRKDIK